MTTERLYYRDAYLKRFRAAIVETAGQGRRVYLDRTAFYPASGGQPHDTGSIAGVAVLEVVDEGDRIAHVMAEPVSGGEVECAVDWPRRFDAMQQHSGQHLLSAVLVETYGAATTGFHMGAEASAIDVALESLDARQAAEAERRANQIVFENRPLAVSFEDRSAAVDLRKPAEREGVLRIVSIAGLDRSACGGTHVRATGEIGPILLRKLDKAHGGVRIEFLCGLRAVRRARADFDALARIARVFSAAPEETPALVESQSAALEECRKGRRRAAAELARYRGAGLHRSTSPDAAGLRTRFERLAKGAALDDELRSLAQGFAAGGKAAFLAALDDPPSLLLAASPDSGLHAGELVKAALAARGGRGGGNAQLAQGSAPAREALEAAIEELRKKL